MSPYPRLVSHDAVVDTAEKIEEIGFESGPRAEAESEVVHPGALKVGPEEIGVAQIIPAGGSISLLGTTQDEALHGLSRMRPFLQPLLHIRPLFGDVGVVL